jgi:1,2-diacylglycerol-3-alpha-glucose alpha-1,2-glucosyltransferase
MKGGNFPMPESLAPAYIRQLYSFSDVLITPTEYSKKCLRKSGVNIPIYALSSGIHDENLIPTPENRVRFRAYLKEKYHVPEDMFVVANVGYTYLRKGIDRIYNVAKKMPNVFFIWPGQRVDNHYLAAGEKLPNMAFPGFYPDIRDVYYGADALFFPSYVENLGLPIIEAAMCHLPVVTSRIEAFDWIPENTHCIKGEKIPEYIDGIKFLMEHQKERQEMVDRAYDLAMNLHSFKKIGPRMVNVYEKGIQAKRYTDSKKN